MEIRRIVTGHDAQGKAVFVSEAAAPRAAAFKHIPGHAFAQVWATAPGASLPAPAGDPTLDGGSLVPAPGGTSFLIVTFPPDAVMMSPDFNGAAAGAELGAALPGLIDCFEPDCPGMHRSDSIDYALVLGGEIWLELDDGAQKLLRQGDVAVQNGTRHAWRNRSAQAATLAFILVGAARPGA
ncbi:cupin [Duganella sp. BJB488]|uniref:cupin domain-containing protein n=1 Tax=unclassified Duganella TaxID=2636909 RepID=UPI000E3571A7|nr:MULTISPECIES: cupin domain-containing protein [unclassified Duganella]RFP09292.1 cupin [Duganella sp. BJB475]RFP13181.1 cupin [Duganella sp. BJB489]RFP17059.1 cupin [Duganella sp. BJB488]RFP25328.1 cupin [Duganella sp. BJB476]RFP31535.1 cupin [Duganella sp. BJB480]